MNSNQGLTPSGNNQSNYKEFYKKDYYIKIEMNNFQEIIIIIYNIKLLDNIKYQIKIQLKEFYCLSKSFKMYDTIEEIFGVLIELIKNNNYMIDNGKIKFIIGDLLQNKKEIEVRLTKEDTNNEYLKILTREIKTKDDIIKNLEDKYNIMKGELTEMKNLIKKLNEQINQNKIVNNNISNNNQVNNVNLNNNNNTHNIKKK